MKLKTIPTAMWCIALLYSSTCLAAAPAQIVQTGQNKTSPISPASANSDGNLQEGVAWPSPRFIRDTSGCADGDFVIIDHLTGLVWLGDADDYNSGNTQSWNVAMNTDSSDTNPNLGGGTNQFSYCGHTDWRMPNVLELNSLVNLACGNGASGDCSLTPAAWLNDAQGFSNLPNGLYWSSSKYAPDTGLAWFVNMSDGVVSSFSHRSDFQVLPVRGPVDDQVIAHH